jgi:hypothetical protein
MSGRHRMPLSAWRKLKNAPTLRAGDDILAAYGLAMDELGVGPRGYFLPKALAEALDALLKEFASKKIFPRISINGEARIGIQLDDGDYAKIGRGSKWEA